MSKKKIERETARKIVARLREIDGIVDLALFDQTLDDIELDYGITTIDTYGIGKAIK